MHKPFPLSLEPADGAAWGGFLFTHAALVATLDRELRDAEGLSLSEYEVLLHLAVSAAASVRMSDLASSLPLTPSGVTRVVDRLETGGLVRRARSPHDARSFAVSLTPAGRRRFARANEVHLAGVRRHFLDRLSREDVHALDRIWTKLQASTPGTILEKARALGRKGTNDDAP